MGAFWFKSIFVLSMPRSKDKVFVVSGAILLFNICTCLKMPTSDLWYLNIVNIDPRSLSVCIQALQKAIKYNEFLSQSETVELDDYEESSYMYELELMRLIKIYQSKKI